MRKLFISLLMMIAAGVWCGAAFTSITDGTDLQAESVIDQLVWAYQERISVAGVVTPVTGITAGDDIQDLDGDVNWYGMQQGLESMFSNFVNHTLAVTNVREITNFSTLDGWRSDTGMNTNGFRRAAVWNPPINDWTDFSDPMFATNVVGGTNYDGGFGYMQAGDIIGPWIYVDLQNHFSALKETPGYSTTPAGLNTNVEHGGNITGGSTNSLALAIADNVSGWNATWPSNVVDRGNFHTAYYSYQFSDHWYYAIGFRQIMVISNSESYTEVPRDLTVYGCLAAPLGTGNYEDLDSYGTNTQVIVVWTTNNVMSTNVSSTWGEPSWLVDTPTNSPASYGDTNNLDGMTYGYQIEDDLTAAGAGNDYNTVMRWGFSHSN